MKKIFSLALMAVALLISGQVKAADVAKIGSTGYATIVDALTAVKTGETIVLQSDAPMSTTYDLTDGRAFTIDFGDNNTIEGTLRINIYHGNITLAGRGIIKSTDNAPFRLIGSPDQNAVNWSVLTVGKDVSVINAGTNDNTGHYGIFVVTSNYNPDFASAAGAKSASYGVVINVNGYVEAYYGALYINGSVQAKGENVPQINVGKDAVLVGKATDGLAIYAGGYGNWTISGTLEADLGIYVKAGNISLVDATINVTATVEQGQYVTPIPHGNGCDGGTGSAIVLDSKAGYAGDMTLNISGNTNINAAENAYAIDELKTDATATEVKAVVISSGTINGDINTTAEVKEAVKTNQTITGGTFTDESIKNYISNINGVVEVVEGNVTKYVISDLPTGKDWVATIAAAGTADYVKIAKDANEEVAADKEIAYLNMPNESKVTVKKGAKLSVGEAVLGADAVIEVEAGAKLVINGTNGLIAFVPENIVLKADSASSAVFVLNPNVKANKTPYATVEFYSNARAMAKGYRWDIFACPFAHVDSLKNNLKAEDIYPGKSKGSAYQYWGGTQWVSCSTKQQLLDNVTAFTPIAITNTCAKGKHCTYTFFGQLQGNISGEFALEKGYNYFGNGFMGAMDAQKMMTALKNQSQKVNAVIYVWNSQNQSFVDYQEKNISSMADLKGMDFFILKATADVNVTLDYTTLVWDKNK